MAPRKWSFVVLLGGLLLLGFPNKVKLYAHSEETKTASVKDCKVHIEKALEQYWEHEEPQKSSMSSHQTQDTPIQDTAEKVPIEIQNESDNDNDEDSQDDVDDSVKKDDDDDDEEDDGEDESDTENQTSEKLTDEKDKGDTDDDATVDHDDDDDDADDDEEDGDDGDDSDDGDDGDDSDDGDNRQDPINVETSTSEIQEKEVDTKDEDTHFGNTEEKDQSNLEDEEDEEEDEEENISDGSQSPGDMMESDKVTGEAVSASSRVVQELSQDKPSVEQPEASKISEETLPVTPNIQEPSGDLDEDQPYDLVPEDTDDDTIENMFEEEDDDDDSSSTVTFRSRDHVDVILGLDEIGTEVEKDEEKLAQSIFRDIKKIEQMNIKPMEMLYKYTDSTTRVLGDAEIFNKPMLLFLGPWNSGKTSIINYLLGIERTPEALKTGTGVTDVDFTLLTYADKKQMISGTELAVDWRYAGVQKFGQGFLDHFRNIQMPSTLLKKVNIVDTPGILENKKNTERGYAFNDAFQWFIDRADAIYVVLDPTKVDIGGELGSVLDQLKGREVRFVLNKADTIRRSDLMRVVGQLFWNLSPLMSSTEAPIIYAVSLSTKPYHPSAPARFLADQENNFLYDMKDNLDKRVENRILYARRHAVRVRNHAKMVDCYLSTYYRHKSIFSSKKNVAKQITENPRDYNIFEGIGHMTNVSRYDLPDPIAYKTFFKQHPLYDFKPLASTCSYFRGCPMDKLDAAIAYDIPELFAKYKKAKGSSGTGKQDGR